MAKKSPIQNIQPQEFIAWTGDQDKSKAFGQYYKSMDSFGIVQRASANRNTYSKDIDTNVNVRPSFGRDNYEYFREKEKLPIKHREVMMFCNSAYKHVGIIKNIIDLMSDFASDGIKFVHPNTKVERFYREWWNKVDGASVAERFLNYFYRLGTTPVKRLTAKLKLSDVEKIQKAFGADLTLESSPTPEKREIPWKYVFLNPMTIECLSPEIGAFSGKPLYGIRVNETIIKKVKNPSNQSEKEAVDGLPSDLRQAILNGSKVIPLDPLKNFLYFYKKDDWEDFGSPMISPLIDDILLLEKLRLADVAACDGVISQVRLWTVGNLEHKILPTRALIEKVSDMLTNHVGGGSIDLVFGPELSFKESSTQAHNFLGEAKYRPTLNNIYAGLGIPPTLTGTGDSGGFTNNYISLKTLVERLEYGRSVLKSFIEQEAEYVRLAMGFKSPAKVLFNRMTLSDESSEKRLLIELADRDIISSETLLERFEELPDLERARLNKEKTFRKSKKMPAKRGPYSNIDNDLIKLFVQTGVIGPSELGLDLLPRKTGEKAPIDYDIELAKNKSVLKNKDKAGKGRPQGTKDSFKRKQKVVNPRSKASELSVLSSWAKDAYNKVSNVLLPIYLEKLNRANARTLTGEEFDMFEIIKFNTLCGLKPLSKVDEASVTTSLAFNTKTDVAVLKVYNNLVEKFENSVTNNPSIEDLRNLRICAYSIVNLNKEF